MTPLDQAFLSRLAPYAVVLIGDEYCFRTDFGVDYAVAFNPEPSFGGLPAYWFDLSNRSGKASPNDPKVRETVIRIIIEFFRANPDILLYMCDNANDQQAQRNRLFLRWFMGEEQSKQQQAQKLQKAIDDIIAEEIRKANAEAEKKRN